MDLVDDGGRVLHVAFFSSATVSAGTSLLLNPPYPELVQDYETTFARLKKLECDVFLAPHGGQFAMAEKFERLDRGEKPNPLIDPEGWRTLIADAEKAFRAQLEAERSSARN